MKLLIPLFLFLSSNVHAQTLYSFQKNEKYGFKDLSGKVVVPATYKYASDTISSLGGVSNGQRWAIMNSSGVVLTDFKYDGVRNAKGFDLIPVYHNWGLMGANQSYGLVDETGRDILPMEYMSMEVLSNDLAIVNSSGKYGIMNTDGTPVVPLKFTEETLKVFTDILPNGVYMEGGQWKPFVYEGKQIRRWKYDDIVLNGEYIWPVKYRGKWGYVTAKGVELVTPQYDSVGIFGGGIAWASIAGKKGVLNNKGALVVPVQYERIYLDALGNYIVYVKGKCGLLDPKANQILPVIYDAMSELKEELRAVQLNGKWGFADANGKEVIAPAYAAVLNFSDGAAAVVMNNKIGFINKNGDMIIQPQFDDVVESFYKGKAIVVKDGNEIYIDKTGKEIK